jgi:hypothetical protein
MLVKTAAVAAVAAALLTLSLSAAAQTSDMLVQRYTDLAGSEKNAEALVSGLRDGSEVKLTSGQTTTSFGPPTQKMGYGNIDNALAIAEASLKQQGITNPTAEQLKAALTDVLQMRADGRGWGQIANDQGFKLGDLKRAQPRPDRAERVARAQRPERIDKPQRPERPERPEKPTRPERPGR